MGQKSEKKDQKAEPVPDRAYVERIFFSENCGQADAVIYAYIQLPGILV